jgi:hypothetical protein
VYRSAELWRTVVLVVALLLTAVSTGAFARELRAADPRNSSHPLVQRGADRPATMPSCHRSIGVFHSRRFGTEKEQTGTGAIDSDRTNVALIRTMRPVLVGRLHKVERI